ncbi:MAG TPA: carbohydrate binding domain-containing protein [Candidatus Limnocylindrales bacterium]|nr:carbohydrate binding domain-containing protein [Candidatus Limnocylindrales bacterium]
MLQKRAFLGVTTGVAAAVLNLTVAAQPLPWVLPWNDTLSGVTDFSHVNSPITTERVTVDTNGHFVANGRRIRFLGVNFAGDAPFMPTNNADAVAGRLAKFGVNGVRLHHMDPSWAYNGGLIAYTSTSSTNLSETNVERLHWLVSRLKAHGIYSDVNLLVGREYRSGDGLGPEVTGMDWKDAHILGYFYDRALALQKDYATKLLTPTNRFTGLSLAKDPAVAFVEIINENGIIQKWLDGGLDRLPTRYSLSLQAHWNTWLAARYTNQTAMLEAWHIINQSLGPNLIANGAFSNGLTGWVAEQHNVAQASFTRTYDFIDGAPSAKIVVTNADTAGWYIQLNYPYLPVTSNQVYTISFWAKSSPATNAEASVMQAHANWNGLGYLQSLSLKTNWQLFTNTFQAAANENNARMNFGSMGDKRATFWFADVKLQRGGQIGVLPDGASLAAGTVPNVSHSGSGYRGTIEARRDWLQFLRELEYSYFDAMVLHLRSNLGYGGLIFGTIMANSPATVQSRLDVIDGHAYWQHPQFPGQPWDPVNWNISNISMVNTLADDNTLTGLARQRIEGKPFTVTEYQHPSPNYYGAEGPLLLAAYGALQDWDGVWLFDYGQGNDVVPMGYIRGFFCMDQHPTKMANMLLAANLFRRADVTAARQEFTIGLTPDRELDLLQNASAWSLFNSGQLGVPGRLALTNRLSTRVGVEAASGLTNAPPPTSGSVVGSDTGELRWDLSQANHGMVTIDAARTKAVLGFADNRSVTLGGITFRLGTTRLGWCTFGITLTQGEVLTNDCTALIVATGWTENTGQIWSNTNKTSVGNQWGHAPVLTEIVPFSLTLPVGTNHVRAWTLDERGQRKTALPISGDASSATLSVDTNSGAIWYELRIERWMASFDLWRTRYFSAAELLKSEISSETASPDGDGIANLWKYYLGLPGRTSAPPYRLPVPELMNIGLENFLQLSFERDKLATDVDCAGEVSPDLSAWYSGAGFTVCEPPLDNGDLERVRVRDALPIASLPARYLRLHLQRKEPN